MLLLLHERRPVAELYFTAWPPSPPKWPGLLGDRIRASSGSSSQPPAALPEQRLQPAEVWLSTALAGRAAAASARGSLLPGASSAAGSAASSPAWRWVHGQLMAAIADNRSRQRAVGTAAVLCDSVRGGVQPAALAALQAAGFPLVRLTSASKNSGASAGRTLAAGIAAACSSSRSSRDGGDSQLGRWIGMQAAFDALLGGAYGRPASLACCMQRAVRLLPQFAPDVQLLLVSVVIPNGRCVGGCWRGRGSRGCCLVSLELCGIQACYEACRRQARGMQACYHRILSQRPRAARQPSFDPSPLAHPPTSPIQPPSCLTTHALSDAGWAASSPAMAAAALCSPRLSYSSSM